MKGIYVERDDLIIRFRKLPIEKVRLSHIKSTVATWSDIMKADIITISIDGQTRTIKSRYPVKEQ